MEQIRSFIAIELPEDLKEGLLRLQNEIKLNSQLRVKWVNPNSIHLTLKFLGNVSFGKLNSITQAITEASQNISPFTLEVKELGVFPNIQRVQVVWVGIDGELDNLKLLQQNLENGLSKLGFVRESRPFVPHLTLARVGNQTTKYEQQEFGKLINSIRFEDVYKIGVNSVTLMRSQLTREGAIYSRIHTIPLENQVQC